MHRLDQLRRNLDKEAMVGVEIGPFFSPVAPKAEGWKTTVIDYKDGDALRKAARNHPERTIRSKVGAIEDVDIVWDGRPLDKVALKRNPGGYDFVIASHVIEHTPDILGFLQQCSRLLKSDGIISLAVPDMRKCFDLLKSPTSIREILTAHRERRIRHTPEALFEARAWATTRDAKGAWVAGNHLPIDFADSFSKALRKYKADARQIHKVRPYVDAHTWFFTPASFELAIMELNQMGLLPLKIAWLEENQGSEFIVQMRHADRIDAMSPDKFNAERIRLALKHYAEFDSEVGPSYREITPAPEPERVIVEVPVEVRVEVPVEVRVEVPVEVFVPVDPPPEPTVELAKRLAFRIRRKMLSLVGLA
ncbi:MULTISPECIES: class I SAM-dependent methyltransferase [unclassified Mesorhizobium]|uniref:class I SAM-dependent methyltransferase n=1 Tax=unclassified Mesorhizobium TaxID=325217 RepID=UPI000FD8B6E2|nr:MULTISPECIES: class I SAM-dependent methyltransferase [unclassified Mesorhizobium]TGQ11818.1 class I SAM-dependent methyltransferase [Mesorhizobium sp. M2E.F.Ca.ET.219.01.1.1]TGS18150.1 class I SAM-dependent methyltransferase [Mesorhizobium sp. M2E.F.Ca.ET.209.01.1.1]TGT70455.1 class I SAM-dependent methyltransferase [Mesorhizobium sp. M2E.F.Ca.ET.166.01.1.1]TGV98690.1 class I SAM-dependent methyltransferase [Mesorhizobium sp. M2E.F.Ca.ET.154.01.1.1]